MSAGTIVRVNGPVVEVEGLAAAVQELVAVGERRLPGEVIGLEGPIAVVQVYEHTGGMRPGEPVDPTGRPLSAELGPGLLGGVFDGMLRRLPGAGDFLQPDVRAPALERARRWHFAPAARVGDLLQAGSTLGTVPEAAIVHRVLVPPTLSGPLEWIAEESEVGVDDPVAIVAGTSITALHAWPVRQPRPYRERLGARLPLVTGQRVLDLLYPLARGSTVAVPGGFGTGKTVLLQQVAKWCDADVIVYLGCGERGNEMADVLHELRELRDPRNGDPLLARTVLVANTSNMPVLAREASIHTGVTVAEFYRDMGYDVVLIADSTSRWAEALREVASRTDQLPAEEGYPAGLASELAAFYERAGRVRTLGGADGSVTILGSVSPPGGDTTEPVTAHTTRFVRATWSLDRDLAYARHYPAVSWRESWSRDAPVLTDGQLLAGDAGWGQRRDAALALLGEADRLEAVAQLVGATSLPDHERIVLLTGRLLREAVLQQSALSANDSYCGAAKQSALLDLVLTLHARFEELTAAGVGAAAIEQVDLGDVLRARDTTPPDGDDLVRDIRDRTLARLEELR